VEPILVISPHLDDAVLSMGEFLASWPGATVMTVFAGAPSPRQVTTFDVHSGFRDSDDAMASRWDEDDRACLAVGSVPMRAEMLDGQYVEVRDEPAAIAQIEGLIAGTAAKLGTVRVVAPLGIAHPDHILVATAAARVALYHDVEMWCYEELPNRVAMPEEVAPALHRWSSVGLNPGLSFLGVGPLDMKKAAIACYESQLWALDQRCVIVPERVWRMHPA